MGETIWHSGRHLPVAGDESSSLRVVLIEPTAHLRITLGSELARQGFSQKSFVDHRDFLDSAQILQDGEIIVCGPNLPIASAVTLVEALSVADNPAAIVSLSDLRRMLAVRGEIDAAWGDADAGLEAQVLVENLKRMVEVMGPSSNGRLRSNLRERLALQADGSIWWNDVKVPLTPREVAIVRLLAGKTGRFVSYNAIYGLHQPSSALSDLDQRHCRTSVRSAVKRIRRKFRDCDPAFAEIQSYSAFGYRWGGGLET